MVKSSELGTSCLFLELLDAFLDAKIGLIYHVVLKVSCCILISSCVIGLWLQGLKVSLSLAAVSSISSLDCDVLHLVWTMEKLQQQLDVTDRHYEM